jgi:hypothetical protein
MPGITACDNWKVQAFGIKKSMEGKRNGVKLIFNLVALLAINLIKDDPGGVLCDVNVVIW